jgi:penicillin-binding protein 2
VVKDRDGDAGVRVRLSVLSIMVCLLFVALFSRLWYLQVLAGERYGQLAEGNRVRQVVLEAPRGRILDRKGRVLVRNRNAWTVTVKVSEMGGRAQRGAVLGRLARLLGVRRAVLNDRLREYTGSPLRGVPVAEDIPIRVLFYLTEHAAEFPGVAAEVLAFREYPAGSTAAHLLGYVGEISDQQLAQPRWRRYRPGQLVGKAGVELTYDKVLRGVDGVQTLEVNSAGEVVRTLDVRQPVAGMDLQLSIDLDVQRAAERSLLEGMRVARTVVDKQRGGTYRAPAAASVVLDPNDGSVLAMASLPQYDPRKFVGGIGRRDFAAYARDPAKPLLNRAVQSVYPPGSTWKPFTALTGLRTGVITPSTTFNCPGSFQFGSYVKHDWTPQGHGTVALNESLKFSCDVYYYNIGARYAAAERAAELRGDKPDEQMQATARAFGFGRAPLRLDLPFAASGTVPDRAWRRQFWQHHRKEYCAGSSALYKELCQYGWRWQGGDDLNVAIGQGDLQVSPLQLADGYAALANGGTLWSPRLAKAVIGPDGKVVREIRPKAVRQVPVSAETIDYIRHAMAAVTTDGTAKGAFAGFPFGQLAVGGKTGTAQVQGKQDTSWFASFGPVSDPRYAVVVMIEQAGTGGSVAAPAVRQIWDGIYGLEGHQAAYPGGVPPAALPRIAPDGTISRPHLPGATPGAPGTAAQAFAPYLVERRRLA